ncbi:MAG: hypothetical protein Kow0077_06170 [Anaerolineae bacterium]
MVAIYVRARHVDAPPDEIARARDAALQVWMEHLNAAWLEAPFALDASHLKAGNLYCSLEFYHLADHYARAISRAPMFAEQHGLRLLDQVAPRWLQILPLRFLYSAVVRRLRNQCGTTSLTLLSTEWLSATVRWNLDTDLAALPEDYHKDYVGSNQTVYVSLFRALPYKIAASQKAASETRHEPTESARWVDWTFRWRLFSSVLNLPALLGLLASTGLVVLAGRAGFENLAWVAFLPFLLGLVWSYQNRLSFELNVRETELIEKQLLTQMQAEEMAEVSRALQDANNSLHQQIETLTNIRKATLQMSTILDQNVLVRQVTQLITTDLHFDRALLLITDADHESLTYGALSHPLADTQSQFRLEQLEIPLDARGEFGLLSHWRVGRSVMVDDATQVQAQPFGWIFKLLEMKSFFSVPLMLGNELLGVIIVDNNLSGQPISEETKGLLEALGASISIALQNARLYQRTDDQLTHHVQELDMMRQVDRELMEALHWERVLNMIIDWGLRLTGAHSAALALVEPDGKQLRLVAGYGLDVLDGELEHTTLPLDKTVMGRVARRDTPEIIPDVRKDPNYVPLVSDAVSCMAVPIRRRNRVLGVLSLYSVEPDAFDLSHLDFVDRLANRASVALDNARLLEETEREREKLSSIVEKTADIIIVVGFDRRVILLNEAAKAAFRLDPRKQYTGIDFDEVFAFTPLHALGQRFLKRSGQNVHIVDEITLDDARYFHTDVASNEQVGWLIVMHDVTPFKETERLKNELIATVSHDLKNPLSVINGYIELLAMYNELNERGQEFMMMIRRSIRAMRQLIDDLLDLAHIDAGMEINPEPVALPTVIHESVTSLQNLAEEKRLNVSIEVPDNLPLVTGDERRLRQIIINLVSNAIKYTPPEGSVTVSARPQNGEAVLVSIEDTGLGISPEDQAQIFERFYRVRRPETDGIEGTGLGLAIVKSLVEAHGGEIGLKSHLGEGSTFYFTVPVNRTTDGKTHPEKSSQIA